MVKILALADTPYNTTQRNYIENKVFSRDLSEFDLVVHCGDLWGSHSMATSVEYNDAVEFWAQCPKPVHFVLGDNDWTDFKNKNEALSMWRDRMTLAPAVRWSSKPEYWYVRKGPVLVIGLAIMGYQSDGTSPDTGADCIAWATQALTANEDATHIVFVAQGGPYEYCVRTSFWPWFEPRAAADGRPMLWLQGHRHKWQLYKQYQGIPNLQRIILDNTGADSGAVPLEIEVAKTEVITKTYDWLVNVPAVQP